MGPRAEKLRVGFVGTGLMGAPMVRRLLIAGFHVSVWNRSAEKASALEADGAKLAATPAELVSNSDVVCLCVSDTSAVEAVVFGDHGIASLRGSCRVLVDFSSIRPDATAAMAERLHEAIGIDWVDAPVSGGVKGATDGSLILLCGGDERVIASLSPLFDAVARKTTRMGNVGAGQTTKLCNQVIVATNIMAIAEAMTLGKSAGIDVARLPEALAGGWADSLPLQIIGPLMVAGQDAKIGPISIMRKDIDTALDVANNGGNVLPVAATAAQIYGQICAGDFADADLASLGAYFGIVSDNE